jgi:hypothetical protein
MCGSAMHHLHRAICISSHAPDLAGGKYKLARDGTEFVLFGRYSAPEWPPLTHWTQVVGTSSFTWVPHADYDFVPEMSFNNDGVKDLEVGFGRLTQPLSVATLGDIVSTPMEHD